MKHAKLWYRFAEEYKPLKNTKPPAGQALTDDAQAHLFEVAKSKPAWVFAYVAATLDFFCGLRACEIKALQWKHISLRGPATLGAPLENAGGLARSVAERDVP